MSYSFNVRGTTKAIAKQLIATALAGVVAQQPVHAADVKPAQAAADAQIDLLQNDESKDVVVYVSGSLGWNGPMEDANFSSANVSVNAGLQPREAAAAQ
ncbi:MAG: hypothetical protein V4757_02130 [Pseudomonadota bacterium]